MREVAGDDFATKTAAVAIEKGDIEGLGKLLREAHASMRDLFEGSHPEVDRQVERFNREVAEVDRSLIDPLAQ